MPITKRGAELWRLLDADDVCAMRDALRESPEEMNVFNGIAGGTLLHEAADRSGPGMLRMMIDLGCDPNLAGALDGELPISRAASSAKVENVRVLVELGSLLDVSEPARNPLYGAIIAGRSGHDRDYVAMRAPEVAELLLRAGLDHRKQYPPRGKRELNATEKATRWGALEIRDIILEWEAAEDEGREPQLPFEAALYKAVAAQDLDRVQALFETQPERWYGHAPLFRDPTMPTMFGTWLHCAAVNGSAEIAKFMIASGEDINASPRGWAPVCTAAENDNLAVLELLIEVGAELPKKMDSNPLLHAIRGGSLGAVKLLLEAGCPTFKFQRGPTAAEWARSQQKVEIADLIAEYEGRRSR